MSTMKPDFAMLTILKGYNNAHHVPTWIIYTPTDSKFGGVSAEFIEFKDPNTVVLKKANGDLYTSDLSLITINVEF
jgi:hypothetical protein